MEEGTAVLQKTVPPAAAAGSPAAPTAPVQPGTVLLNTPTATGLPAAPATQPAQVPQPAPRKGGGMWIGAAAVVLLLLGGGAWWALGRKSGAEAPPAAEAATGSPQGTTPGTVPASGGAKAGEVRLAPKGEGPRPETGAGSGPARTESGKEALGVRQEPEPERPSVRPAPEKKAIDQPQKFEQEHLEKLQVHERTNLGLVSMSESIQLVEKDPEKAIYGFRQAIKADSGNVMAHAWLASTLYEQNRMAEFVQELREARRLGLLQQMFNRNVRFKSAFQRARLNGKLPADVTD